MPPEIPDKISAAALAALAGQRGGLPLSPVLPSLQFGDEDGGPCDLQLAVLLLIKGSYGGVNVVQELTLALHLLFRIQSTLSEHQQMASDGDGLFEDVDEHTRSLIGRDIRSFRKAVDFATSCISDVHATVTVPAIQRRAQALLGEHATFTEEELAKVRSQLLISDEILSGLQLDRTQITEFLESEMNASSSQESDSD